MKPEVKWLMDYIDNQITVPTELNTAMSLVRNWSFITHNYESKNTRIAEWNPYDEDIYAILCDILICCFMHGEVTYQAMIGFIQNSIRCADQIDRIKCAAEVIALAYQADLIVIVKTGVNDTMMIHTEFELDETLPDFFHHQPEVKPYVADTNQILGCRFKQHNEDTCIEHINTMNAIPLALEWRVINDLAESTDSADVHFTNMSHHTYENIGNDRFYLKHLYDTRGRTYCQGYYVNYQGSSYKKAIVCLANREIIPLT